QLGAHEKGFKNLEEEWRATLRSDQGKPTTHYAILSLRSFKVAREKTIESLRAILGTYINPYDEMWSYNSILGD
ncbi:11673_t:CDS:1, partial [Funneliformis caledonium]